LCDLQSTNARYKVLIPENTILNNVEEVPPPNYYEVSQVIKKFKAHKAAGSDNIPAELIKHGGIELKRNIYKLIMKIWKEETLPTEWTEGIICPIYKKGTRTICSNHRPINLLNVAYKIFTILINNRLSCIVESKLEDCQMGFRPTRSTIDNIFIVRQIIEKCHEFNIELNNVFIDYTQAFDSMYRDKIIKCLNKYDMTSKLIKLIAKTLQDKKLELK
jgi:sorting nexin-29